MKRKELILLIILIVVLVFGAAFLYFNKKNPVRPVNPISTTSPATSTNQTEIPKPAEATSTLVTYYCQEGIIKAEFKKDEVVLNLADSRTVTLPQSVSGSGIRYESGTTTFLGKGDNANLSEKGNTTYTNCVAGLETNEQNNNVFSDTAKTFSFSYPNQFVLSGGDIGYSQDWNVQTTNLGLLLAVVKVPKSFLPQTNFSEAKFTVGTSVDPAAIKDCFKSAGGSIGTTTEVAINNQKFTRITLADAGAGNFYETTSYRTIYNNQCYAIEYTIHSTNIDNYSPDQGIKEFDKKKIEPLLENIVSSFKFLKE